MPRYRIALVSLALLALGSTTPLAAAAQDATVDPGQQFDAGSRQANCTTPQPGLAPDPLALKGSGKTQTRPFDLAGGAYTVTWELTQISEYATYGVRVVPVVDAPFNHGQAVMSASFTKNPDASGETHIYDVKPGRYYLAIEAPKGWRVTFTPLPI